MSAFPLPAGWAMASIADVIRDVQTADPSTEPNVEITYFDIGSIDNEAGRVSNAKTVLGADAASRARQVVQAGDVLFSTVRPNLRAIALVPEVTNGIASTGFCVLRAAQSIHPHYLYFYARSEVFLDVLLPLARGVSYPAVRSGDVVSQRIPVAPAAEQTRIVEKLEELLSGLDAGVAELKAAQKKLAQYRQSLLKAAVEGALTAQWRAAQSCDQPAAPAASAESGAALLARILSERRSRWEARQLAKFAAQGKTPPKDWQAKYPAPAAPDTAGLPALPQGWVWASLNQLVGDSSYGTSVKCSHESQGVAVLRIPNVVARKLVLDDLKYATQPLGLEASEYLAPGDILIVRTNGSIGLVGRAAEVSEVLPRQFYFASYLLRVRCIETVVLHRWISAVLASNLGRKWIEARAASSAGLHNISLSTLLTMPVPLPPLVEQSDSLNSLEMMLSNITRQEEWLDVSLKQSAAQRKNILQAAFSGQLVAQDPADEPASALLARIRAERAARAASPGRGRGKTKGST